MKMDSRLCIFVFVGVLSSVSGQVPSRGGCPTVDTVKEFDLNQYLGHWYEQEKFYAAFEADQTCASANYSLKDNGHIKIVNSGFDKQGNVVKAEGDAYIADKSDPGKLKLRFSDFAPYGNYWIVDTDYKTYTLIYSCTGVLSITHLELAWILTRERQLDPEIKDMLYKKLAGYGVDTSNFKPTDQSNCPATVA